MTIGHIARALPIHELAEHPEQFPIIGLQPPKTLSDANWRVTVDEAADDEMMQHLRYNED